MEEKTQKGRKKVIYLITKGNWGGAQKYVFDLAKNYKDKMDVVVAIGEGDELAENLEKIGIKTIKVRSLIKNINFKKDIESFSQIQEIFDKEKPDIVHLNSSKAGFIGALAAKSAGVKKVIFTAHGWAFNDASAVWQKKTFQIIQWITVFLSNTTITVSQKTKKDIKNWPLISKKIQVIYNGIEKIEFLNKKESRARLLPKKGGLWIGTISELNKNKGLDILIEAFANLKKQGEKRLNLVIIGEGGEREKLQKMAHNLGISENIFFLGFIEEANKFLKAFDIFTLTSRTEGLPFVLLEAGLAKLPVIATKVGGISEIIKKGNGILIEKEDAKSLEKKLKFLIDNPNERTKLATNLEKVVNKKFTAKSMEKATYLVYNS